MHIKIENSKLLGQILWTYSRSAHWSSLHLRQESSSDLYYSNESSILWADQQTKTLIFSLVKGSGDFCEVSYSVLRSFFPEVKDSKSSLWMGLCVVSTSIILWWSIIEHIEQHTLNNKFQFTGPLFCNQISSVPWAASGHIPLEVYLMPIVRYNSVPEGWHSLDSWKCLHLTSFVVIAETNAPFQETIHIFQK